MVRTPNIPPNLRGIRGPSQPRASSSDSLQGADVGAGKRILPNSEIIKILGFNCFLAECEQQPPPSVERAREGGAVN